MCFRRVRMVLTLGDSPPPHRQLVQRLVGGLTLSDEVTAHRRTCPADPTPAVQIDRASRPETFFDLIKNGIHSLGRGQAKIPDGKTMVDGLHVIGFGLL